MRALFAGGSGNPSFAPAWLERWAVRSARGLDQPALPRGEHAKVVLSQAGGSAGRDQRPNGLVPALVTCRRLKKVFPLKWSEGGGVMAAWV
jgi:hypothetical protein